MTYAVREAIFSKDYITIADMQALLGMGYDDAAKKIRDIKRALKMDPKYNGQGVRLDIQGKLHVQDYLDYFNITDHTRYCPPSIVEVAEA
jgi:hypothetical protein